MESVSSLTYLKFNIGGYFGSNYEVILNKKTVTYYGNESLYNHDAKHKKKISKDDLELFIAKLNKIGIADWENDYFNIDVLDGEQWELKVSYNDKLKKSISGSNCYPYSEQNSIERTDVFIELMEALVQLIQEPTFFTDSFQGKPSIQ